MAKENNNKRESFRFGIGEWYGKLFTNMSQNERKEYAEAALNKEKKPCPFQYGSTSLCNKAGGVCSLRCYLQKNGETSVPENYRGMLRTTCPNRFEEDGLIFRWVSEIILHDSSPKIIKEVGFLEKAEGDEKDEVGRIDMVLVSSTPHNSFSWCALEIQAVYFSGGSMNSDFHSIMKTCGEAMPFPAGKRRPDYRSSGPKRLMPQLQIKVPTLRRWGKKMAVVVDRDFFDSLGPMDSVQDLSNCDIVWFVVKYSERDGKAVLERDFERFTTLERAVEGLTGGKPVSLNEFESRVRYKLSREHARASQ